MKKIFLLLFFIIPSFFPSFIYSQLPNTTYATSYAGISFPTTLSGYSPSFNGGIGLEFAMSKMTALGFEANFANMGFENNYGSGMRPDFGGFGYRVSDYGSYSTMGLSTFFKIQNVQAMRVPVQPFVKLGAGFSLMAEKGKTYWSDGMLETISNSNSVGILLAPSMGMNIVLKNKNKIVLEAQYRINRSSVHNIQFFLVNAGYSFGL